MPGEEFSPSRSTIDACVIALDCHERSPATRALRLQEAIAADVAQAIRSAHLLRCLQQRELQGLAGRRQIHAPKLIALHVVAVERAVSAEGQAIDAFQAIIAGDHFKRTAALWPASGCVRPACRWHRRCHPWRWRCHCRCRRAPGKASDRPACRCPAQMPRLRTERRARPRARPKGIGHGAHPQPPRLRIGQHAKHRTQAVVALGMMNGFATVSPGPAR